MGLIHRLRRQAVNDQVFRRTAVAESLAQVNLDAADAGDALDSRKLRFPFLQRPISFVAVTGDRLDMLAQFGGGGSLRERSVSGRVRAVHGDLHCEGERSPKNSISGVRKRGNITVMGSKVAADWGKAYARRTSTTRLRKSSASRGTTTRVMRRHALNTRKV